MEHIKILYYLFGIAASAVAIWRFILWKRERSKPSPRVLSMTRDISEKDFTKGVSWLKETIMGEYNPTLILAISSGGAAVGGILSKHLNIPLCTVARLHPRLQETVPKRSEMVSFPPNEIIKGEKVLLVDDIVRSGQTLQASHEQTFKASPSEIKSAALLLAGEHPLEKPDFYIYEAKRPGLRMFYDIAGDSEER